MKFYYPPLYRLILSQVVSLISTDWTMIFVTQCIRGRFERDCQLKLLKSRYIRVIRRLTCILVKARRANDSTGVAQRIERAEGGRERLRERD